MTYSVKETFYTLQGEGVNTGRPSVFIRFSGCNLWSGREPDRLTAVCQMCDTDFVGTDGPGGGRYDAMTLARVASDLWPGGSRLNVGLPHGVSPLAVLTGGEPMLQVDQQLISCLHSQNFEVAVETNGTRPVPPAVEWITVSPKAGTEVVQRSGQELKLVFPQDNTDPASFLGWNFKHFVLQPRDGPLREEYTRAALGYVKRNPRWRLGIQTHKVLQIP